MADGCVTFTDICKVSVNTTKYFFRSIAVDNRLCLHLVFLVGGGSGFVGRELTRLLRDKGHEVTVISRQPGPGKITWV